MTEAEDEAGPSGEFSSALGALGPGGTAFLVAGDVPPAVHERACERFLGAPGAWRRSLVVATGGHGAHASASRTVRFDADVRGAAATDADAETGAAGATSLADLGESFMDAIGALERGASDGDLRVCLDGLDALSHATGEEAAFRFCCLLVNRIRAGGGIGHVHLAGPPDGQAARLFEPLFDGTVALRVVDGEPEERWHLAEADVDSGWLPLGDATDL